MPNTLTTTVIVVVDDNPAQRYATRRVLENAGFKTRECATGQEALSAALEQPDLIILDVKLPDVNGFEVCRRLKSDPATASIPVLHLSATIVSTSGKVTGLEAGADAYLTQPVEPDELVATIRTLLRARAAEQRLRASEQRYRSMFEHLPLPSWLIHGSTLKVLAVNPAALHRYGYSSDELGDLTAVDPFSGGSLRAIISALEQNGGIYTQQAQHRAKDGIVFAVQVTWVSVELDGTRALLGIVYDLTDRRAASEARQSARLRREMLRQVLAGQEQERRRVARELHDEAGQLLTSLLVGLQNLESAKSFRQAKASARQLRTITATSLETVTRLARGLHPAVLEDLGLGPALDRLAVEFSEAHSIPVKIENSLELLNCLDRQASLALYRIAQEALTNVSKHAKASKVTMNFSITGELLRFVVVDDGIGYDVTSSGLTEGRHLGVQGMRERAAMLGGKVTITSAPRRGTTVTAFIPTAPQNEAQSA